MGLYDTWGPNGGQSVNLNQLYAQQQPAPSLWQSLMNNQMSGYGAMQNLGSQVGQGFAAANAQSGYNMASQIPLEVEQARQQGMSSRLGMLSPLISAMFGGGAKPLTGVQSNFGQFANLNGGASGAAPAAATKSNIGRTWMQPAWGK